MITINLLPNNLKKTEQKIVLPYKSYIVILFVLLIFLHFCLFSLAVIKKVQIAVLKKNWTRFEPRSKDSTSTRKEVKDLETGVDTTKRVLSRKASLTELFSSLNAAVPRGLWLERFSFSEEGLVIQGSVVSLTQNEMTIIGKFLQDLKNNKTFSSLLSKIELNSVQRRTIKTYDVVDFVLIGELKK